MAHDIEVIEQDDRWAAHGIEELAIRAGETLFETLGASNEGYEIAILACDDSEIARLNQDFRDKGSATNVLSWPFRENGAAVDGGTPNPISAPAPLGDIAISYDTCMAEATAGNLEFSDHVTHLLIHGMLHLLGYDHETDKDADLMEGIEVKALASLGLHNPY